MTVTFVSPGKQISLYGGLGPLKQLALSGPMSFKFNNTASGSKVIHQYKVRGHHKEGFEQLSKVVDQVQTLQMQRLADYLNGLATPN
jgi:hypothetical protein